LSFEQQQLAVELLFLNKSCFHVKMGLLCNKENGNCNLDKWGGTNGGNYLFGGIGEETVVSGFCAPVDDPEPRAKTPAPSQEPVTPTASPTKSCPSSVQLVGKTGKSMYGDIPIEIVDQNIHNVTFRVKNEFAHDIKNVYTQFQAPGRLGQIECIEERDLPSLQVTDDIYTAECYHKKPLSIIDVWYKSCDLEGDATIPNCCHPDKEDACATVRYAFELACDPEYCPEESKLEAALQSL